VSATAEQRAWVTRVLGLTGNETKTPSRALSLVKLGKSRLGWRADRLHLIVEIGRLQSALADDFGQDEAQAAALATAVARLDKLIEAFSSELDDSLDAVLNAADPKERLLHIKAAKTAVEQFGALLRSDAIIAELDGNEVLPDMSVAAPLRNRLDEISAALG